MTPPPSSRYLGIDLGTTNSSVCYTSFNTGTQKFDEPRPVRFGNDQTLSSMLLLDVYGQKVVASGQAVYRHPDYLRYPERVHQEFKLNLEKDPSAAHYTHLLAGELLKNLQQTLNTRDLAPDEHQTSVGVPAEWQLRHPQKVALVEEAARRAGFPNVQAVVEPIAAMYFHAFLGDLRFEDRPQRWLVIDIGGGTTDLALVETTEAGQHPKILHTFGRDFGGKDFDRLLLEQWFLPRYWLGPTPTPKERLDLLQWIRDFKEKFSDRIQRKQDKFSTSCRLSNVRNPVTLTRQEFETADLANGLIERFAGLLGQGMAGSGQNVRAVDRVILTGGSARWYFVREAVDSWFGREASVLSANPELTIAKGLSLAHTGFKVEAALAPALPPESPAVSDLENIDLSTADQHPTALNPERCRQQARAFYTKYATMAGAVGLVLSPIPGASQPVLSGIEGKLAMEIAKVYGYQFDLKEIAAIAGGILAGGTLAKVVVMEAMTFVPGIGWAVKGGVAAAAIPAMGETFIKYFEFRRFSSPPPPPAGLLKE